MLMVKAIFIDEDNNEITIEIPETLVALSNLIDTLERLGDEDSLDEIWENSIGLRDYELSKIYTDLKGLNNDDFDADVLELTKNDIKNDIKLKVSIFSI